MHCNYLALVLLALSSQADARQGIDVQDIGVDCSGSIDSSTALQAAIDAAPDGSVFLFPSFQTCKAVNIGHTITIKDRSTLSFVSPNDGRSSFAPRLQWSGDAAQMFDVQHSEYITFQGFTFNCNGSRLDKYINFDGEPGERFVGSNPKLYYNAFQGCGGLNDNFKAVSIAATAQNNWENAEFVNNTFDCGGRTTRLRSRTGSIVGGSNALKATAGAAFVAADVGQRIRISYRGGMLDTMIDAIDSGEAVRLRDAAPSSQDGVTVHTGTAAGIGIYNGASANAKHNKFYNVGTHGCAYGIRSEGGSVDIRHVGGGSDDVGIYIRYATEPILISHFEAENDLMAFEFGDNANGPVTIQSSRIENSQQRADGFIAVNSQVVFMAATLALWGGSCANGIPANGVLIRFGDKNPRVTSIASNWAGCPLSALGFDAPYTSRTGYPTALFNDAIDPATAPAFSFGCAIFANPTPGCVAIQADFGHVDAANALTIQPRAIWGDKNPSPIAVTPSTPAASSEACMAGTLKTDASFIYVCTATNQWKRATLSGF